jgi:hypothetical protein
MVGAVGVRRLTEWQRRRSDHQQAKEILALLDLRAQYLELLSATSSPGVLLHIIDAIDHADAQLDVLDPEHRAPRGELVSIPRS